MTGRPPARALPLLLLLAGCQSIPTTYAPPIQRRPVYGPEGTELTSYVAMNDARVQLHIESGVSHALENSRRATVRAVAADGSEKKFEVTVRVDTPREADYYRSGGILPYVVRQLAATGRR